MNINVQKIRETVYPMLINFYAEHDIEARRELIGLYKDENYEELADKLFALSKAHTPA